MPGGRIGVPKQITGVGVGLVPGELSGTGEFAGSGTLLPGRPDDGLAAGLDAGADPLVAPAVGALGGN